MEALDDLSAAATHLPQGGTGAGPHRVGVLRLWTGLSRLSKRLIGLGATLLLVMIAAVSLMMWDLYNTTLTDARQNVGKLGIAIAEQTARSIQAVDLVLEDLRKDIQAQGIETPEAFTTRLNNPVLQKLLLARSDTLPQADAFTIIDARGRLVNFSRQWPIPPTDLSDRDYYLYLSTHNDDRPFISRPVQNRGNGGWTVYVVRRVSGPNGVFLGMVLSAIDLTYFQDFYKALTVGAGTTVTLLRNDGTALTSYPATARIGEMLPASSYWHEMIKHGPGAFVTQGVLAPGMRLVFAHPLVDYPLVVNISVTVHDALKNWRRAVLIAGIGTASAVLCVAALLRALLLQVVRLEASELSLAQQNAQLEMARHQVVAQSEELSASRHRLAEKSDALETTLNHMNQGIMMVSAAHVVEVCNQRAIEMLDLPPDLLRSRPTFESVVEHQRSTGEFRLPDPGAPNTVGQGLVAGQPFTYERKRPNGRILEIQSVPLTSGGMVRTYTDTTQRRLSEERVRYFAHHDDLTKLVNRVVFQEELQRAISLADTSQRSVAVLYLDLDRFKQVNDTRGHGTGDKLLVEVAQRLRNSVRDTDTVARMGGDEFAIIQPLVDQPHASAALAARIKDLVNQPYFIDGAQCSVGVSIGIALYPEHAGSAGDLLRNADMALYRAKADGRNTSAMFEEAMDAKQQQLFHLEQDLKQALARDQFELEYQPIVDAQSCAVLAYEALLRWRHPERGLVGPANFIAMAEASGQIIPIGLWVLETACAEASTWPVDTTIYVNLSPLQFRDNALVGHITDILSRTGLSASQLGLEVTEGLMLEDSDLVLETMSQLRALGVQFNLDDFGTAHAGLSYLRRFHFDAVKIDKSFVQEAPCHQKARAIVIAVLAIGKALGLRVIAEGVETEEQLGLLRSLGCQRVQGYLTGRPRPASQIRVDGPTTALSRV